MVEELGSAYTQRLAAAYPAVGGVSDYVCYWFPKAHDHLAKGGRAGLVATNSVRQNESREASLDYVVDNGGVIFDAVSTQPWSGDAKVFVSIVNWAKGIDVKPKLLWLNDGNLRLAVDRIPSSLAPTADVRSAVPLAVNQRPRVCFQGQTPGITQGYVIDEVVVDRLLESGGRSARSVIHPFLGGRELLEKTAIDRWVIDVPWGDLSDLERMPGVYQHLKQYVLPERRRLYERELARNEAGSTHSSGYRPESQHELFMSRWWQFWRHRTDMLNALSPLDRYIATSRVSSTSRTSVFAYVDKAVRPGDSLTAFAFDDDYSFGILSSAVHRAWLEARCSTLKGDLRYTPTTCPFTGACEDARAAPVVPGAVRRV